MHTAGHHAPAGHPHLAECRRFGGKYQSVKPVRAGDTQQPRGALIQHQQVRACTHGQAPVVEPSRRSATGQRAAVQMRGGGRHADVRPRRHVALLQRQALAVFKPAQLFGPVAANLAVRAQRQRRAAGQPARQVCQAVAQIGLGAGAQHDPRAAGGNGIDFSRQRVRGVHQLPARVQRQFARQPFDGPRAGGGQAVVHLGGLFGNVDVDGAWVVRHGPHQRVQRLGRHGAQRVHGHPRVHQWRSQRPHAVAQGQHLGEVGCKPPLVAAQRGLVEAGALVEHRQQRQPDAGGGGGINQCAAHGQRVGIRRAGLAVVQVVEFTHLRIAATQQFGVQLRGHGTQLRGRDAQGHAVHAGSPAPEVVLCAIAPFSQAGECTLEGVAVRVHQTRQHRAGQHLRGGGCRLVGLHLGPAAVAAHPQQHVVLPGPGNPGLRRPQQVVRHAGRQSIMVCTSRRSSGVTSAARASCQR